MSGKRQFLDSPVVPSERRWIRSWRRGLVLAVTGLTVLLATMAIVANPPAEWEVSLFRSANELPRQAEWVVWPLQQAGMAMAVPVGAVLLWLIVRHWRPPIALLGGGILFGWAGAKLIKEIVGRGRPAALLDDVQLAYDVPVDGLGFPSGHAVVAFTLATVMGPYLRRRWRVALYLLAVVVAVSRVYVGAHLPLDVVAGAAYGTMIGALVDLAAGRPVDRVPSAAGR